MSTTCTAVETRLVDIGVLSADNKKELITSDAVSIKSASTLCAPILSFTPTKSLYINARGISILRLPLPPRDLETTIHNTDGSLVYTSTRAKRDSGDCVLSDAQGHPLTDTRYFFGPGKDPVIRCLDSKTGESTAIKAVSKWTAREHTFLLPSGQRFTWSYRREKGFGKDGRKRTGMILEADGKRIAALIRNEETRAPGSKSCSAGNGGELVLVDVGINSDIDEALVVASCLLMLKKEIDRRRIVQFMMIAGAASGGG